MSKNKKTPAIPPEDYSGAQADWMIALQERGLWDGNGWHGDVMIPEKIWWEILGECEGGIDEEELAELNKTIEEYYVMAKDELSDMEFGSVEEKILAYFKSGFASAMVHFENNQAQEPNN